MRRAGDPRQGVQPVLPGGCGRSGRPHRLDPGMAKKRVHEIAKQRGMPSKEVIAILQKAGLDVKTAAQSVDENDIEMAFNGGKGAKQTADQPARQPQSQGGPRPLGQGPVPERPAPAPAPPAGGAPQQRGGSGG